MLPDPLLAGALGSIVGLILALTGAGGGVLAVPLLVFGLHLGMAQAAPVGLTAVGLAAALGALLGLRDGLVRYRAASLIGGAGLALAPLGVRAAAVLPDRPLMLAFAAVLALVAWRMGRHGRGTASTAAASGPAGSAPGAAEPVAHQPCRVDPAGGRLRWTRPCAVALAWTGAFSGLLTGMLGVGGGFVIVPALTRFTDLPPRQIVATSLAVIALVSVGGIVAAACQGALAWDAATPFALGAVLALLVGRRIVHRLAGHRLNQAFAIVCALVCVLMIARALGVMRMPH